MVKTRGQDDGDDEETGVTREFLNELIAPLARRDDLEHLINRIDSLEIKFAELESSVEKKFQALNLKLAEKDKEILEINSKTRIFKRSWMIWNPDIRSIVILYPGKSSSLNNMVDVCVYA